MTGWRSTLLLIALLGGGCATSTAPGQGKDPRAGSTVGQAATAPCPPAGTDRAQLTALQAADFRIDDATRRNALALELLACLGHPDPFLRDEVAYTGLAAMMRRGEISQATARTMLRSLSASVMRAEDSGAGFRRPFAAIVLAEVARMDRVDAFLSPQERRQLVHVAHRYLASVSDYRGFDDDEGWRHGVAHGADLALQLVLNEQVDARGLRALLEAVFAQVAPGSGHAYVFGEPDRLARTVLFAATRGLVDEQAWVALFDPLVDPAPFADWSEAFRSQAGLARLHDTRAFAYALEISIGRNLDTDFGALPDQVDRLIRALP